MASLLLASAALENHVVRGQHYASGHLGPKTERVAARTCTDRPQKFFSSGDRAFGDPLTSVASASTAPNQGTFTNHRPRVGREPRCSACGSWNNMLRWPSRPRSGIGKPHSQSGVPHRMTKLLRVPGLSITAQRSCACFVRRSIRCSARWRAFFGWSNCGRESAAQKPPGH